MKIYKQKLRDVWLQMEEFRAWLRRDPDDSYRAHCRFCKCCVNTKISDLRAHAATKKHMKHLEYKPHLVSSKSMFLPNPFLSGTCTRPETLGRQPVEQVVRQQLQCHSIQSQTKGPAQNAHREEGEAECL